jgi:hypothetical protein
MQSRCYVVSRSWVLQASEGSKNLTMMMTDDHWMHDLPRTCQAPARFRNAIIAYQRSLHFRNDSSRV